MSLSPIQLALLGVLAVVGAYVIGFYVWSGLKTVYGIIRDLAVALHDAVALAREFRSDFAAFRAFMAFQATQAPAPALTAEDEADGGTPKARIPEFPTFPTPVWDRFETMPERKPEPDAPLERIDTVDVTASEEEVNDLEKLEELRKIGVQTEALESERPGRQVESE